MGSRVPWRPIFVSTSINMTRAANPSTPLPRKRAVRAGGGARPSLEDCKANFRAKMSQQPYSKRRYSACKWSRPFLYREEDNEYFENRKKRHLDWVGRRLSRRRKTRKAEFKSRLMNTMANYDEQYRDQLEDLQSKVTSAERTLKREESSLRTSVGPRTVGQLAYDQDTAGWITKHQKALADGKKMLASLRRRQSSPDLRDLPNVDFKLSENKSDVGKLSRLNKYISRLYNRANGRRYSGT